MIISDQRREENFQEYLLLLRDSHYVNVIFDEQSGGVSAIHRDHKFDSETGAFGIKIGKYERIAVDILRKRGHRITLESELAPFGVKTPDGYFDGMIMEIKSIDGFGRWAIKDKLHEATKQKAECVIFYFHKRELYSLERMNDGWDKYLNDKASQKYPTTIKRMICIVGEDVFEYEGT